MSTSRALAGVMSQRNSKCIVKTTESETPVYAVLKGNKEIYAPVSDGVVKVLFSPNGRYIALSAGELNLLDIERGKYEFGVVIVNCETGSYKGYVRGRPVLIAKWNGDKSIQFTETLRFDAASGQSLP